MDIRRCEAGDVWAVYDLICALEDDSIDRARFDVAFMSKLRSATGYCIVGVEGGHVRAFLSMNVDYMLHHAGKVAVIEELVVGADCRGRGIGQALVNNAIDYAAACHCDAIELTSNFSRTRAHAFYERNGFVKASYKFTLELGER